MFIGIGLIDEHLTAVCKRAGGRVHLGDLKAHPGRVLPAAAQVCVTCAVPLRQAHQVGAQAVFPAIDGDGLCQTHLTGPI